MSTIEKETIDFEKLLEYLKYNRSFDFTGYKRTSLARRVQKRMQAVNVEQYIDYLDYLEVHPDEFIHLFNTILINVTSFFRDPKTWEFIDKSVIPSILAMKKTDEPIRIWSAGCASGEETYSIAMLLAEHLGLEEFKERVKIYATDLDEESLAKARMATYSDNEIEEVPAPLLEKYFERIGNRYVFLRDLRRSVIFGRHDLTRDAPISRIDLIVCRNVLMYFNAEAQVRILTRLNYALNDRGYLFLGKAEMLLTHMKLFSPLDLKNHIFIKSLRGDLRTRILTNAPEGDEADTREGFHSRLQAIAFDTSPLAQIVINTSGQLTLINERARGLFGLSLQDVGRPFHELELSYRPVELRSTIEQVTARKTSAILQEIEFHANGNEAARYLEIHLTPLPNGENGLVGVSITFRDVSENKVLQRQLEQANQELETAMEELQSTNEELETTNEELQSTIEELETTNEELQSTNEELETMNEELQSTNEELETMNDEMTQRTNELNQVNYFLESILTSLRGGVIVLNTDMSVEIWNSQSEDLWGLRYEEVHGRNLFSLDFGLPVEQLKKHTLQIMNGDAELAEASITATNRRGRSILCYVTCTPLYNNHREVRGVVIVTDQQGVVVEG